MLLANKYLKSQARVAFVCNGINSDEPGFDVITERVVHNTITVCVSLENL